MAVQYWVVGGEYTDTSFSRISGGAEETRLGPFAGEEEAHEVWSGQSMAAVDNCLVRFRIERTEAGEDGAYWVIGGTYADTGFRTLAKGCQEDRIGPFDNYDEALNAWRGKAWATVDDGFTRYRIERA